MEIKSFKISLFLLLLVLPSKNVFAVGVAKEEKAVIELSKVDNQTDLNGRMISIEAKSKKQEVEIEVLTTLLEEEKKFTKQLSGRISQLESSASETFIKSDQILERPKRPVRLIPTNIPGHLKNKIGNDDETEVGFYGLPTTCKELGKLGHTLNGYYLVHNDGLQVANSGSNKIEIRFCRFQLQPRKKSLMAEERVGFVSIINTQLSEISVLPSSDIKSTTEIIPVSSVPSFEGKIKTEWLADFPVFTRKPKNYGKVKKAYLKPSSVNQPTTDGVPDKFNLKSEWTSAGQFISENIPKTDGVPDQFNWKSESTSAGQFIYAEGCDFCGYDIEDYRNLESKEICREKCLLNTDCTHVTWASDNLYYGACFLKKGPIPPDPLSPRASPFWHGRTSSICGYFSTKI